MAAGIRPFALSRCAAWSWRSRRRRCLYLIPTGQSISLSGTPNINIVGGPQRSIQINSSAATAFSGASKIDLSLGGPNGTGSDFGVFGGPAANPGVKLGDDRSLFLAFGADCRPLRANTGSCDTNQWAACQ